MPPKKQNKIVKKTVQAKAPLRRRKRDKYLLANETKETPKLTSSASVGVNGQKNARKIILTKNDINIMLANEVVQKQFPPKSTKWKEPEMKIVLDTLKLSQTKTFKKKHTLKNNVVQNGELSTNTVESKSKGRRRILSRKLRSSQTTVESGMLPQHNNESTETEPSKNKTKIVRRNKAVTKQVDNNLAVEKSHDETKQKIIRRKLTNKRKPKTTGPRTRKITKEFLKDPVPENATSETPVTSETNNIKTVDTSVMKFEDVVVRRNSLASLSELSWTKDISSSSTTTLLTVSSKDFFRIDNKIPVIKLTNFDRKLKVEENNNNCSVNKLPPADVIRIEIDNSFSDKSAINSCDNVNDKTSEDEINTLFAGYNCNLSSTSESHSDLDKSEKSASSAVKKINNTLDKLSSKLKSFDLEIINWIGYTNDTENPNIEKIQQKLYKENFLKEEMDVLVHLKKIKQILSEKNKDTDTVEADITGDNLRNGCENIVNKANLNQTPRLNEPYNSLKEIEHITHGKEKAKTTSTDASHEDDDEDDALSLYAESLTGIESSSKSCKEDENVKDLEEYVPQPLPNKILVTPQPITYQPTKITTDQQLGHPKEEDLVPVCEKQNADSTSIYKEQENDNDNNIEENNIHFKDNLDNVEEISKPTENFKSKIIPNTPLLMEHKFKTIPGTSSAVFKGVCYYNLISNCKNKYCKYPHVQLGVDDVRNNLKILNNTTFTEEYMLLLTKPSLNRKFGMTYLEESFRRKLTDLSIQIALYYINKVNNRSTVLNVVENVLLYLNGVNLCDCEELLKLKLNSVLLCDCFISTIAMSQNFSRFKSVFVKLTNFMYRIGRTFSEDVAANVLERIVILPYDKDLAQALLKIIENTDNSIFSNSMIKKLEQQLMLANIQLYEEFRSLKGQVVGISSSNLNSMDNDTRHSPDTTNLDTLNKVTVEPKFTRTIDLNNINYLNFNGFMGNSSLSDGYEKKRFVPKSRFQNWRGKKPQPNNRNIKQGQYLACPLLRSPYKRKSDQAHGGPNNKYQRIDKPNFY